MTEGLQSPSVLSLLYVRGHGARVFLGVEKNLPRSNGFYHFSLLTLVLFFRKNIIEVFLVNCGLKQLPPRLDEAT